MSVLSKVANFYWLLLLVGISIFLPLQNALTHLLGLSTYIDEFIQLFMLAILIWKSFTLKSAKFIVMSYAFLVLWMSILSIKAVPERGLSNVAQQIFVHSKYIVFIGFFYLVVKSQISKKVLNVIICLSVFFLFFDLLFQGTLNALLDQKVQMRGGSVRPIGIQGHTANLGFFMSMLAAYFICSDNKISQKAKFIFIFMSLILVFLTSVRTALVVFPIILAWGFRASFRVTATVIGTLSLIFVAIGPNKYFNELVEITQQNIINTIENPTKAAYIRGMMIYFSFELANERFPVGTGAATFGTVKSDDSAIYAELGVRNSRFFIEKDGIYDSNFASVLGEFGYLGFALYYYFFISFILRLCSFDKKTKVNSEFLFVSISLMLVYSFTNPVFMNTNQIVIFALFLAAASKPVNEATHKI
ncbi:O-antigen ligase family protein [Pseudoalteromonas sp. G4]|uniref:O-antigen ligase family protein n=1 Tax=Pseudoalteromonas sp. G4 TaxID=2992761 RepID=UPI00237D8CED|nr:hypothetical protein [Pseudoalteromonas sp. G4]MDE3271259.1 hypothetical protein [Pseudoalteromonas sp. G4]